MSRRICNLLYPMLFSVICVCSITIISGDCWRDILISIAASFFTYFVTVSLPDYRRSVYKHRYVLRRIKLIRQSIITLFENLSSHLVNGIPSDKEIIEICNKVNFLEPPKRYPMYADETPSWDTLLRKCVENVMICINELIIMCDHRDAKLIDVCSGIKEELVSLRMEVQVLLSTVNHRQHMLSGLFCQSHFKQLVFYWRELDALLKEYR